MEPDDKNKDVRLPEYEYNGVVYTKSILGIMSEKVVKELVMKSRENILLFWNVLGSIFCHLS
jgi:hypothetical protein